MRFLYRQLVVDGDKGQDTSNGGHHDNGYLYFPSIFCSSGCLEKGNHENTKETNDQPYHERSNRYRREETTSR